MDLLLRSKAFWTALLSFVGVIVARYLSVPEEIWQSFAAFAVVVIGILTVDELGVTIGRTIARGMRDQEL